MDKSRQHFICPHTTSRSLPVHPAREGDTTLEVEEEDATTRMKEQTPVKTDLSNQSKTTPVARNSCATVSLRHPRVAPPAQRRRDGASPGHGTERTRWHSPTAAWAPGAGHQRPVVASRKQMSSVLSRRERLTEVHRDF